MTVLLAVTVYVKKFIIIYIDVKHKTVRNRKRTKTAVLNLQSVQSVRRGKTQKPNRDRQFNNIETVKVPTLGSGINDVMFGGGGGVVRGWRMRGVSLPKAPICISNESRTAVLIK